jgi:predicted metal-dependent hydrolase
VKTSFSCFKQLIEFSQTIFLELMSTKAILINGIEILLKKNSRARHLSISIKPFGIVTVTVPERLSYNDAKMLAFHKIKWIEEHLSKMKSENERISGYDENTYFKTRNHQLVIKSTDKAKITVRVKAGFINVHYPNNLGVNSLIVQKAIRKGIEKAYREEAKEYLPKRLNDLSDKSNLPFNEVYIKNIKSRWGSCSGKNNINLSIHLMRLPDNLIDYVLLHELAHTKIKNHSKKYWQFMDTLVDDAKKIDKELRQFKITHF